MTEKELDREYIGRQANEIKNLEKENKVLKDTLVGLLDAIDDWYNISEIVGTTLCDAIQKAKALLKEKETK